MSVLPPSARILSKHDAWAVQRKWLEAFARDSEGNKLRAPSQFMWQLFSLGQRSHVHGSKARSAYTEQTLQPYYVFSEAVEDCAVVETEPFVVLQSGSGDWYVVPQDFSWTYISTHEGTEYFAQRGI